MAMSIKVGDIAPAFTLPGTGGRSYSLSDFAGKPLVIAFYPGDDTPVCTKQLNAYNNDFEEFENLDAAVVGISAQDIASHEAFAAKHGFRFPLLSDVDKTVAAAYGTLGPLGFPRRSVFVVGSDGRLTYVHRALAGVTYRSVQEITAAISTS
ncbi:MAG: peroxiredoxin [Acidimicrobiia bacterium]|nr:peroxiredoxin [Actinomycetota bacterium]NDB05390.1 peroxiredoxin [Acidimicrobiia bacterium]NDD97344.1 peroxiredoxin [Actinomycetota bacterium]NDE59155.1 peroxiredoxin [Acidimicrobiia bacterium]NDE80746.1 peroxiredoxin [Actinomycetota bacterium]